jgi:glyoxylase-like metal-dependent hydrolase (beta-lactamase superfamily II)
LLPVPLPLPGWRPPALVALHPEGDMDGELEDRTLGSVTVLFGERGGKYPQGNTLWVRGSEESLLIDPSLGLMPRRGNLPSVDRVLNSHCHEDHVAGNRFHFVPRPDALAFSDGQVFDLGGGTRVRVIHAPGHTRGHCLFHIEPDDVLHLGDIDLSSFGPYYGDAWSDLEDFERTLAWVRDLEARHYATFHHVGVLEDRAAYLDRFDRFAAVIGDRERRLLEFLTGTPRSLDDIVAHRFVFRPGDDVPQAPVVETRSMSLHVERLLREGRVREVEPGRYLV